MKFTETKLKGAFVIEPEYHNDERGSFARTFCQREFKEKGIDFSIVQCNVSMNSKKATLRGMHYQEAPFQEAKMVSCFKGEVFDVIIDLRKESSTYKQWDSVFLSPGNGKCLFIPKGFAHGFLTLEDNTGVYYQMAEYYNAEYSRGVLWNDPAFHIRWSENPDVISEQDRSYPQFTR